MFISRFLKRRTEYQQLSSASGQWNERRCVAVNFKLQLLSDSVNHFDCIQYLTSGPEGESHERSQFLATRKLNTIQTFLKALLLELHLSLLWI